VVTPPAPEPEPAAPEPATDDAGGPAEEEGDVSEGEGGVEASQAEGAPKKGKRRPSWSQLHEIEEARDREAARVQELERRLAEHQQQTLAAQQALGGQQGQTPQGVPGVDRPYTQAEIQQLQQYDPTEYARVVAEAARHDAQITQQQMALMQQQMTVRSQIDDFRKATPDYDDAVKHLEARETARLKAAGIPDQYIQGMLQERAGLLIRSAMQQGKTVPQLAYEVAKADGWVAPSAQVAPAVAPAQAAQTPEQRVAASKAKSAAAAGSIGNIPGSASSRPTITREDVMGMSEAEMEKLDKESPGWQEQISA